MTRVEGISHVLFSVHNLNFQHPLRNKGIIEYLLDVCRRFLTSWYSNYDVNENIPFRELSERTLPDDVEIMCVEINLKKQKWILRGIYRPPNMNERYFLDNLSRVIDCYSKKI